MIFVFAVDHLEGEAAHQVVPVTLVAKREPAWIGLDRLKSVRKLRVEPLLRADSAPRTNRGLP